jgi:MFS transporter, FHS family, L-fucose permease
VNGICNSLFLKKLFFMQPELTQKKITKQPSKLLPMIIIGTLFFIFGFITWINGTLIPYLKIACELKSDFQSYLVATAFFIAYTVMAIPSSLVLKKTGYKIGMALGLVIMSIGTALFIPAANTRDFYLFLTGLFVIGTGLALLQTASNPYVSILGPLESAASRISIMGICNKTAGIIAGLIFGYITLNDIDLLLESLKTMDSAAKSAALGELAARVILPYTIITGTLVFLAVAVLFSPLPDIKDCPEEDELKNTIPDAGKTSALHFPHLVLGVIAMFLYVGVEVMAGDTIINYGKYQGIELAISRYFTSITLGCMLVGYIIGIVAIPRYITQAKALALSSVLGILFTVFAVYTSGFISVACIALLGLANSLMWPSIFPLAINKLGQFTKTGSALLIMAIAGGAILPLLYARLSEAVNMQRAYWIMAPCYFFILFFAIRGSRTGTTFRSNRSAVV